VNKLISFISYVHENVSYPFEVEEREDAGAIVDVVVGKAMEEVSIEVVATKETFLATLLLAK
jgi:uncharacterized protein (UPF0212 family)